MPGLGQRGATLLERKPPGHADREHALGEQLDQSAQPSAVRDDLHRPHGDVPLGRGQVGRDRGQPAAIADRPHRRAGARACRVGRRVDAASGQRAHLLGPVRLVVVEHGAGPHRRYPAGAVRARRGDDRRPAVRGQLNEHASGDAAGAVHQHRLPGPDLQRGADGLVGGERRDRQRGSDVERHVGRYGGDVLGGGDEPLGPGALLAQRNRMRGDPVPGPDPGDPVPDGGDEPGGLDAQRHRRADPEIPAPGADELIPVAHSGCPHVDQDLIRAQRPRLRQLEALDLVPELAYACCSHGSLPGLPPFARCEPTPEDALRISDSRR